MQHFKQEEKLAVTAPPTLHCLKIGRKATKIGLRTMKTKNLKTSNLKGLLVIVLGTLLISLSVDPVTAEPLKIVYEFERPEIRQITTGGETYDRIFMPGSPNGGDAGYPALPTRGARLLIPYGTEISSIEIIPGEDISLGSGYYIEPVTLPFPISLGPDDRHLPHPDELVYSSTNALPGKTWEEIGTYLFRGYSILTLKLNPVEYIPATGELSYYAKLTVIVNTDAVDKAPGLYRGLPEDDMAVRQRVDNQEAADTYLAAPKSGGKSNELLIITSPTLAEYFQPLKDYHDTTGIPTEIVTTTDIGSAGTDDIRDYIRDRYLNDGIQYVLIGGDDHVIQPKKLFVKTHEGEDEIVEWSMPSDFYFGCLDGTFDYDADGFPGEPTDGEGGGDVDLMAEVYIGRASASISADVTRFVNKTIQYLEADGSYLDNFLMCGEHLRFSGWGEYGGYSLDELIDGSDEHGYTTVGIPSSVYSIDRLYDLTYPGNNWPASQVTTRVNNGLHVINHFGHCNADWALKMTGNAAMSSFVNSDHFFIYSQGCIAGQFDGFDGWAEKVQIKIDGGAFAAVMNARFGFGAFSTDGPSHRFNREFWDAVFNPDENITELGRTNQDSKEDNLYRINELCMRWCYYELNLFGDPTISFKTKPGIVFDYPDGVPEFVSPDETTPVNINVSCVCDASTIPGSGQLHYMVNGGPQQMAALSEPATGEYVATLPELSCGDIVEFYISVEETTLGVLNDPDPASPHLIYVGDSTITIYEDDFETENGWITEGQWARGIPTGEGGVDQAYGGEDPIEGTNGPSVYGYNLSGDYNNYMDEMNLTSTPIDCSAFDNVKLSYMRWLGVERSSYDHAYIRVSSDGINWTTVWTNTANIVDNLWVEVDLDITETAANQATVYLRWTMGETSNSDRYCGWNIDDVQVTSRLCTPAYICGDANGDAAVNVADAVFMINYVFKGGAAPEPVEAGDANGDGDANVADAVYLINYVFNGGPPPLCP